MNQYLIASFEQMLKEDPRSRVFLRLAEEYRKGGEHEKAVEVCENGLHYHPNYIPALVCLGRCHESLGKFEQAEAVFKQVLQTAPDNPHALRGLGNMLFETGSLAEALDYFETLSIHEPNDESIRGRIRQIQDRLIDPVIDQPSEPYSVPEEPDLDMAIEDEEPELLDEDAALLLEDPSNPSEASDGEFEAVQEPPGTEAEAHLDAPHEMTLDDLDSSFERAVREADETLLLEAIDDGSFGEQDEREHSAGLNDEAELSHAPPSGPSASALSDEEIDTALTRGLKHEKMEHLEEASRIYKSLLASAPNDPTVQKHLARVEQRLSRESKTQKKVRLLSNFLDKVKGGVDVPESH